MWKSLKYSTATVTLPGDSGLANGRAKWWNGRRQLRLRHDRSFLKREQNRDDDLKFQPFSATTNDTITQISDAEIRSWLLSTVSVFCLCTQRIIVQRTPFSAWVLCHPIRCLLEFSVKLFSMSISEIENRNENQKMSSFDDWCLKRFYTLFILFDSKKLTPMISRIVMKSK